MKKKFMWKDSNGDNFYDGFAMEFLIELECKLETKASVQVLRDQISSAKVLALNSNIPDMLEHITSVMVRIREIGETHDNLMKDAFDALLTIPNTACHQYFQPE